MDAFSDQSNRCTECGGSLASDGYESTCSHCGLVNGVHSLDASPIFKTDDAGHLIGLQHGPALPPGASIFGSTFWIGRDGRGDMITNPDTQVRLRRLKRSSIRHGRDRRALPPEAFAALRSIVARLELPQSVERRAVFLLTEMRKRRLSFGRPFGTLAAVTLMLASRERGGVLRPTDLARAVTDDLGRVKTTKSEIGRLYRTANRALGLRITPPKPQAFVPRLCSDLGLSPRVQKSAMALLRNHPATGGSPVVHAAAAVHTAANKENERRGQEEVGMIAECSAVALRNAALKFGVKPRRGRAN